MSFFYVILLSEMTYKKRDSLKRQSYIKQISRERRTGVELVDVKKNQGVSIDV